MSEPRLLAVWVNPLAFLEVDEPWATATPKPVTAEAVLDLLTTPGLGHDISSIVARYREISVEQPRLFAAPAEERILEKFVWPLRHAKASYAVGNYLGTISLCGMVAEMVAVLLFETCNVQMNGAPVDARTQRDMFGSTFEKLGQERRVAILRAYGAVNDEQKRAFDSLREIRRRYLHLWSQSHDSLPQDAVKAFLSAMQLVCAIVGHGVGEGGSLRVTPAMERYLAQAASRPAAGDDDESE